MESVQPTNDGPNMPNGSSDNEMLKRNFNPFPITVINIADRDNRPIEASYPKWEAAVEREINKLKDACKTQYGFEMTELEVYKYMSWAMEVTLARVAWSMGYDSELYRIVASVAYDARHRYVAHRTGTFPPPAGERFDTPQELEDSLQDVLKPPTGAPVMAGHDPRSGGGYL